MPHETVAVLTKERDELRKQLDAAEYALELQRAMSLITRIRVSRLLSGNPLPNEGRVKFSGEWAVGKEKF